MADLRNIAKGLLGKGASDKAVDDLKTKLATGLDSDNPAVQKTRELVNVLMEQVEPYRGILKDDEMEKIYQEARLKVGEFSKGDKNKRG